MIQEQNFKSLRDAGKRAHLLSREGWLFLENPRDWEIPRTKDALATEFFFIRQKTDIFPKGNSF